MKPLLCVIGAVAVYLVGAESALHWRFPIPQLYELKQSIFPRAVPETRYSADEVGRLISDESKTAAACPKPTDRTAVLVVLGQSNAANYGGQRYRSRHGAKLVNYIDGRCFIAASPLLGSSGTKGEYWTEVGNGLIDSGKFDQVVLAPVTLSGSEVLRWARGGDLNAVLKQALSSLQQSHYTPTYILWHQGEMDAVIETAEHDYRDRFLSMVDTIRGSGVTAPIYVSTTSKCLEPSNGAKKTHAADNPVVRAQAALPDSTKEIRAGVNSDALLDEDDRYDDCHLGGSGEEKIAREWTSILLGADRKKTTNVTSEEQAQ
jgi:hypothetical protein